MSGEEKQIMNKMIYCNLVNGEQALKFNRHIEQIQEENKQLHSIIKEAREYIEEHTENIDRGRYYEDYVETYPILEILDKEKV